MPVLRSDGCQCESSSSVHAPVIPRCFRTFASIHLHTGVPTRVDQFSCARDPVQWGSNGKYLGLGLSPMGGKKNCPVPCRGGAQLTSVNYQNLLKNT